MSTFINDMGTQIPYRDYRDSVEKMGLCPYIHKTLKLNLSQQQQTFSKLNSQKLSKICWIFKIQELISYVENGNSSIFGAVPWFFGVASGRTET